MAVYLIAKVKRGKELEVLQRLKGIKNLIYAHLVFGDYDVIAKFEGSKENIYLLSKVINRIKGIQIANFLPSR